MATASTYKPLFTANQPGGSSIVDQNFNGIKAALDTVASQAASTTAVTVQTGNYAVGNSDDTVLMNPASSTASATLPDATQVKGRVYTIKNISSVSVSVSPRPKQLLEGTTTPTTLTALQVIRVVSDGSQFWTV